MSSQYPNSGSLFMNDRQRQDSRDPDRNGSVEITCPHCNRETAWWINGWFKTGRSGIEFLSLSLKVKENKPASKPAQQPAPRPAHPDDNHYEPGDEDAPF